MIRMAGHAARGGQHAMVEHEVHAGPQHQHREPSRQAGTTITGVVADAGYGSNAAFRAGSSAWVREIFCLLYMIHARRLLGMLDSFRRERAATKVTKGLNDGVADRT